MKKWVLSTIVGTSSLLVGGGIATGVILPKTLELRDGISNFVPVDGSSPMRSWNAQKKLNYVALGDSETAGFNGFLQGTPELAGGKDYISYADILAKDLNNAHHLNEYHNYAVSGATIPDQQKMFGENQLIHKTIKEADLITLTIGANDLLSFVRLLDMPFKLSLEGIVETLTGQVVDYNAAREKIFGTKIPGQTESPSAGPTHVEGSAMLHKSIVMLADMIKTGNYNRIINLEEDFKEKVFDLIYRNFMMFIHDLREVAPHAQIVVLGHAMPFAQWPSKNVLDVPRADMGGQTIRDLYKKMITKMREGATFSLSGDNDYTSFLSVDDLTIRKSTDGTEVDNRDGAGKRYTDYIKYDDSDPQYYVRNAMPNAADIHPSTFGHQLIGNALFDFISPSLGISNSTLNYTYTKPFDGIYDGPLKEGDPTYADEVAAEISPFERIDENPELGHTTSSLLKGLLKGEGIMPRVLENIIPLLTDINDFSPLKDLLQGDVLKQVSDAMSNAAGDSTLNKAIDLLTNPANQSMITNLLSSINQLAAKSPKSAPIGPVLNDLIGLFQKATAITDGNILSKLSRAFGAPANQAIVDNLITNLNKLKTLAPETSDFQDLFINLATLLRNNNQANAPIVRPLLMLFTGDLPERHYTDLNDYMAKELGMSTTRITKQQMVDQVQYMYNTIKSIMSLVNPGMQMPTLDLLTNNGAKIDAMKSVFDNINSMASSAPSSALQTSYDAEIAKLNGMNVGKFDVAAKAGIVADDMFNYMVLTNIIDKTNIFNDLLLQLVTAFV